LTEKKPIPDDKVFIDSNILIYAYSITEPDKRQTARDTIDKYNSIISIQVINEFSSNCLKKLKKTHNEIITAIQEISRNFPIAQITIPTVVKALQLQKRYQFSYFDCIMLASALENNCTYIFSEDMQHGQVIEETLTIMNPFI
jgi:predicted nucleic acid-binding protein